MDKKKKKHYNLNQNHLSQRKNYQNYQKKINFIKIYNQV